MRSLDVIVFCSIGGRVEKILEHLKITEVNHVFVISGAGEQYTLDLSKLAIDLVICDSFCSQDEVAFFRVLCETSTFFSILKSDDLEPGVSWGISGFLEKARKYNAGCYSASLDQIAFNSLILKVATVKGYISDHSRTSFLPQVNVLPDNANNLCRSSVVEALETHGVIPYYQPKICLKTNKIHGVEVSARLKGAGKTQLLSSSFLEVIEQGGLQGELFNCLFEQGLKLHKYLYSIGESLMFSYSIEASQFVIEGFAECLIKKVRNAGLPVRFITLEVTEKQTLTLDMAGIENISTLVTSGVGLSLSNFGSGLSSITRLTQLPFYQIKLSSEFISQSLGFMQSRIIESIVSLASSLNLEIVAEGVESDRQKKHLIKLGVDAAQGYQFYKPMDGLALVKILVVESSAPQIMAQR